MAGIGPQSLPNGNQGQIAEDKKKKITRTRISYSCHECRKRKIKCDKVHPRCGNCTRSNETCTYDMVEPDGSSEKPSSNGDVQHGLKRPRDSGVPPDNVNPQNGSGPQLSIPPTSVVARLDRLTSLVEALRHEQLQLDQDYPSAGIVSLKADVRPKDSFKSQDTERSFHRGTELPNDVDLAKMPIPDDLDQMGYLSISEGGRSRYIGSSYFAYIADEMGQLNQLLRAQNKYISATAATLPEFDEERNGKTESDDQSEDSDQPLSFHSAAGRKEHHGTPDAGDCPQCGSHISDKSILFRNLSERCPNVPHPQDQVFLHVPTRRQSDILFRCWFSGVHSMIPITYPPVTFQEYEEFWKWYEHKDEDGTAPICPSFIPLLYAIWYAGSVSVSIRTLKREFRGMNRATLSSIFHDQVLRWLLALDFPRDTSVPTLAAYLLLISLLAKEEEPLNSTMAVAMAIRSAQQMGLHRDPELFGLQAWEIETRRRMWWHIYHMDMVAAIACGLPPIISDDNFWDVKQISELKDGYIGTTEGDAYLKDVAAGRRSPESPGLPVAGLFHSMVDVHYVVARAKYKAGVYCRRLIRIQLRTSPITRQDFNDIQKILGDVDEELQATVTRIPAHGVPELGYCPTQSVALAVPDDETDMPLSQNNSLEDLKSFLGIGLQGKNNSTSPISYHWKTLQGFHAWSRIYLSLLADKGYCLIYGAFLRHSTSKLWPSARHCAIIHCHAFMREFIALASGPGFQPFNWSWPGTHQPMHAAMIMLVDLWERPKSEEAPVSRTYIDKIFAMSGPDGGIVSGEDGQSVQRPLREGGREAWTMLRRLRDRAWRKAGLDPHIYWTHEQQHAVGAAPGRGETDQFLQGVINGSIQPVFEGLKENNPFSAAEPAKVDIQQQKHMQERGELTGEDMEVDEPSKKQRPANQPDVNGIVAGGSPAENVLTPGGPIGRPSTSDASESQSVPQASWTNGSTNTTTSAASPSNLEYGVNEIKEKDLVDAHFDWEAWDNVFGHSKLLDDTAWSVG